eukprot:Colp12_sorted_trinity150504_noHs@6549
MDLIEEAAAPFVREMVEELHAELTTRRTAQLRQRTEAAERAHVTKTMRSLIEDVVAMAFTRAAEEAAARAAPKEAAQDALDLIVDRAVLLGSVRSLAITGESVWWLRLSTR